MPLAPLLSFFRGKTSVEAPDLEPDFDARFYKSYYGDLRNLDDEQLRRHYLLHGKAEGRISSPARLVASLEEEHGRLPEDFDAASYRAANPDLAAGGIETDWHAIEHFLRHGRREGRPINRFDPDIYRALYFRDRIVSDDALREHFETEGRHEGRIGTGAQLLRSRGIEGGSRWIAALETDEFAVLNFNWAGSITTKLEAVDAMLREGISRLAPISFTLEFDAAFYRETHPPLAAEIDAECYRHWLFVGFENGEPGTARQFFSSLGMSLSAYPASFRWNDYAKRVGLRGATRWEVLRHFLTDGFAAGLRPMLEKSDGAVWLALGMRHRQEKDRLAIEAFRMAREAGAVKGHSFQDLADCCFRLALWEEALEAYEACMGSKEADLWTFCNGARAALKLGEIDRAFEILTKGKDAALGTTEGRKVLRQAIEAEFARASEAAHDRLREGARPLAEHILADAVAKASERWAALDPLGAPLPAAPDGKIVILANLDLPQCTHYRVEQKRQLLEKLGRETRIFAASEVDAFISALPGSAAAIFYRLPAYPMNLRAIEVARALGVPTYYEIDDLVFDSKLYPEPFETYRGAISENAYRMLQFGAPLFRIAMSLCDYGIASTTALATHMTPIVRKGQVFVLPNGLDSRNEGFLESPPARVRRDRSIVLFYGSGTKAHNSDFVTIAGRALAAIMARHADVELRVVGHVTLDAAFEPFRDRIVCLGFIPDIRSYWSLLAEADINLAVLSPSAVTDAKSEIKWLEAAVMGIPSVASATARYREVLKDGIDVLLAEDAAGFEAALERLIDNPSLRRRIGEQARAKAAAYYSLDARAPVLASILPPLRPGAAARAPARVASRRILVVNVYFPPQTVGGATRVVRDNIDCFRTMPEAQDVDFAIVTTDLHGEGTGLVRVEDYRGCPVFRLSTSDEPPLDWRPRHGPTGRRFRDVLSLWAPDLVHFHCIQRLTASVVEECARADIPYLVTVHDAWWVSDWQFLIDHKDRLREPAEPVPFDPPQGIGIGEALDRRRLLGSLLAGAEEILAVSETFAELYRRCGFERILAVPNGVPPLADAARVASASGRVRLAHIGSMTKHKGYHLVQAALKQDGFRNLELTVVDHRRIGGEVEYARWGATPVRFVGKTRQEDMHRFYAETDVLLAPSLWPESYGLVAREALSAGLWVVASDRGALGEDVTPGRNGWRIDVSTPKALSAVLAEIDADPGRYLRTPPRVPLRTARDQASDLVEIYRDVLARKRRPKRAPAALSGALRDVSAERPESDRCARLP